MNQALTSSAIEFFFPENGEGYTLYNGVVYPFYSSPNEVFEKLQEEIDNDEPCYNALRSLKLTGKEALCKLAKCRYGAFSNQADYEDGRFTPEFVFCTDRSLCEHQGIICKCIQAENGIVSFREMQIIKLVVDDLPDKLIADTLKISVNTVVTHLVNIRQKTAQATRAGIVAWAVERGITSTPN